MPLGFISSVRKDDSSFFSCVTKYIQIKNVPIQTWGLKSVNPADVEQAGSSRGEQLQGPVLRFDDLDVTLVVGTEAAVTADSTQQRHDQIPALEAALGYSLVNHFGAYINVSHTWR